ncbi:MAG: tetratricopeptide repeat protein [Bryobacterales bacterium]|nr:tetratricopeptide repeat protein [Bryobacterales bacterium]
MGSESVPTDGGTAARWPRIEALFHQASELPAKDRTAFLLAECASDTRLFEQVDSLLKAGGQGDSMLQNELAAAAGNLLDAPEAQTGDRLGPYRILKLIGRGGMGSVYLADRDDSEFEKQVAIKVARAAFLTPDALQRFLIERQILARLEHENIARLLDGGRTGTVPYVVMEYVAGVPITTYAKERNLNIPQRLELFRTVCSAVRHAHQSLVVHRDLKPSNILVTNDGIVKLVDFGIAKLIHDEPHAETLTQPFERILTPEYASPEQITGTSITTASDIYSLGVVLYELLAGESPYRFTTRTPLEVERVVCKDTPTPPSVKSGNRKLAGDLDNIVLCAMRKEPARRYGSAAELSDDIRRYLEGYPVMARQEGVAYRMRKFISRNKLAVSLSAVLLLSLAGFAITMASLASRYARERDAAREVSTFLVRIFERADTGATKGESLTARQVLDEGVRHIERELPSQPALQSDLFGAVGRVYSNLGILPRSLETLEKSLAIRQSDRNGDELDLARNLREVAEVNRRVRNFPRAGKLIQQSLEIRARRLGLTHPEYADSLDAYGMIKADSGDLKAALPMLEKGLEINRSRLGPNHPRTLVSLSNLGGVHENSGNLKKAEPLLREALAVRRRIDGDLHSRTALSVRKLSRLLEELGQLNESESLLVEALATNRKLYGDSHPEVALTLSALASVLQSQKQFDRARALYQQALDLENTIRPGDLEAALVMNNLATLEESVKNYTEAESLYRQSLAIRRAKLGSKHPTVARALTNLGQLLFKMRDVDRALPILTESLAIRTAALGPQNYQTAEVRIMRALVLEKLGRPEAAREFAEGFTVLRKALPKNHWRVVNAEKSYAAWHKGQPAPGQR